MANIKCTLEELPDAIKEILDEYEQESIWGCKETVHQIATKGAQAIRAGARANFNGKKYAASWRVQDDSSRIGASATIYSGKPGLPHLLEHGHAKRGGGRTSGRPHIAPVEQQLIKEFVIELENRL